VDFYAFLQLFTTSKEGKETGFLGMFGLGGRGLIKETRFLTSGAIARADFTADSNS
jgi:hypothetical protein